MNYMANTVYPPHQRPGHTVSITTTLYNLWNVASYAASTLSLSTNIKPTTHLACGCFPVLGWGKRNICKPLGGVKGSVAAYRSPGIHIS